MEWWQILLIVAGILLVFAVWWAIRRRTRRPKYIVTQGEIAEFLTDNENAEHDNPYENQAFVNSDDDEGRIDKGASKPVQCSFVWVKGPTFTVTNTKTGQTESFNVRQLPHKKTVDQTEFQAALTSVLQGRFGETMLQFLESGNGGLVASNKNGVLARVNFFFVQKKNK